MKILHFITPILMVLFLLSCQPTTVTYVYDGDTIKVGGESIRLIGVDTPENEWKKKGIKEECYAKQATEFMKEMVLGKKVRLESDSQTNKRDKYNRLLAYVYVGNTLVNAKLIREGYGLAYTYFPFTKSKEFKRYHNEAKQAKRGIWEACKVVCKGHFCKVRPK